MKRSLALLIAGVVAVTGCKTTEVESEPDITELPLHEALEREISDGEFIKVVKRQFAVRTDEGRFYSALDMLPLCVERLSSDQSYSLFSDFLGYLSAGKRYDDLARFIDYVRNMFPNSAGLQELGTSYEIIYLADMGRYDKATTVLITECWELSDANLAMVTGCLGRSADKASKYSLIDRIGEFIVTKTHGKNMALKAIARMWVKSAADQQKFDEAATRIDRLLATPVDVKTVARAYVSIGRDVISSDGHEPVNHMIKTGRSLLTKLRSKSDRELVARILLDYSCLVDDFDTSLEALKICHDNRLEDKEYVQVRNKIMAHKALKEGRKLDAVKRFRDFMEAAKEWDGKQFDPITGESVPVSAVLGLNAARIGDILASINRKEEATESYAEAREYYLAALKELKKDSEWNKKVRDALDLLKKKKK